MKLLLILLMPVGCIALVMWLLSKQMIAPMYAPFMIVGIVVVFGTGLGLYFRNRRA